MAKEKRIDSAAFQRIMREKTSFAESLRAHQDEKQSVLNEVVKEVRRVKAGAMSKRSFNVSMFRMRKEISRLDTAIRSDIKGVSSASIRSNKLAHRQSPRSFRISTTGVRSFARKRVKRRRAVEKAVTKVRKRTVARRATRRRRTARRTTARRRTVARRTTRRRASRTVTRGKR